MKYTRPTTVNEAVKIKNSNENNQFLAGGTELNSLSKKSGKIDTVIDIQDAVSDKISKESIKAMATLQDILNSSKALPAIKEAARHVNNRNIRNSATIGGNIGANKSSSDLIGTLIALKAVLDVLTKDGQKEIAAVDWIQNPSGLITEIIFPDTERNIFHRRFSRTKNDLPIVKVTVGYKKENSNFKEVVIAAGSVAEKVTVLNATSNYLDGKSAKEIDIQNIKSNISEDISPIDDHRASAAYRLKLVKTAIIEFINDRG